MKFVQQSRSVMMIRPMSFGFNNQTAGSNSFQKSGASADETATKARQEFDTMKDVLLSHEIPVHVFDDDAAIPKPDAIFPNNWISFHPDGTVILYPMLAENRRLERRVDVIEGLKSIYAISKVVDLSGEENNGKFLEGTGSLVFDHVNRIAYANRSQRTNEELVIKVCKEIAYSPLIFDAVDQQGQPIYHTNVLLCVGEKFAVVCLDAIRSDDDQEKLLQSFEKTGHKVVAISYSQMEKFAGNMMEVLSTHSEPFVLMSESAFNCLLPGQLNALAQFAEVLPLRIPTIEQTGGGSVRCMVAGIHLPKQNAS
jgi:hypothetical protein